MIKNGEMVRWNLIKSADSCGKVTFYDAGRKVARPSNHAANGSSMDFMPSNACQKSHVTQLTFDEGTRSHFGVDVLSSENLVH